MFKSKCRKHSLIHNHSLQVKRNNSKKLNVKQKKGKPIHCETYRTYSRIGRTFFSKKK